MTMIILYFLMGTIFGAILLYSMKDILTNRTEYTISYKGLDLFIDTPLNNYTFVSRTNHFIKIVMGNYVLYLDLNKKELNIFSENENSSQELLIFTSDLNRSKIQYLFERLREGFHYDIYVNVTIINDSIISKNILNNNISEEDQENLNLNLTEYSPSLDEILDKINKHGIENLTQSDLDILNGH